MARDAACGANNKAVCDRNASKDQKAAISNQHGCSIKTLPALDGALRALDVAELLHKKRSFEESRVRIEGW